MVKKTSYRATVNKIKVQGQRTEVGDQICGKITKGCFEENLQVLVLLDDLSGVHKSLPFRFRDFSSKLSCCIQP